MVHHSAGFRMSGWGEARARRTTILMRQLPGFLNATTPLIDAARSRARNGIADVLAGSHPAPLPDPARLEEMLFDGARDKLEAIVTPTLALEINVARLRGNLRGETAEDRYANYVHLLQSPHYSAALSAEYPTLFDLVGKRLATWVEVSLELVGRLAADWPAIVDAFFDGKSPGALVGLRFPQRSTKRGGRAIVLLSFESGRKLVYKPRSLAVEARFHDLLAWLNHVGFEPGFQPVGLLDRDTHGWMAWVDPADCATPAEVERFYRRQGAYLALFYALEATDLHMSNVIAAGEHPALIDLETLFHPRDAAPDWPALDLALDDMRYYSVLRPGLLPEPETADGGDPNRLDLSGLAGAGGQRTPYAVPAWRDKGTDAMRLEAERRTISGSKNLPSLGGRPVDVFAYLADIEAGFTDTYRLLAQHQDELLARGGLLDRFAGVEIRVMPRSGRRYGAILESSYHPDLLRDADARPAYLADRLRQDASDEADPTRLIEHELSDLLIGDTPLFTTRAGSRDIISSRGVILPDFFARSGLEMARQRIAILNEDNLARQRWFIRASFATVAPAGQAREPRRAALPAGTPATLPRQATAAAEAVGRYLSGAAIHAGQEASWLGLEPDEDGHWSIEPLDTDLAHGLPGVILFLEQLAQATGDQRWRDLAAAALGAYFRYSAEEAEDEDDDPADPIGLFDGLGGRLYALSRLAALGAGDPVAIGREASHLVERSAYLLENPVEEEAPGLADGLAGCLTGLLVAHIQFPELNALDAAQSAGDLLLDFDWTGEQENIPNEPNASFYFGPAGAIEPLLALSMLTGDPAYRVMAAEIAGRHLSPDAADPGLWQAYLSARRWLPDDRRRALDGAMRERLPRIAERAMGDNHSLGYGDLGYIDLLFHAAAELEDDALAGLAARMAAAVVEDIRHRGPREATPLGVESPGLLAGLAGIGYGLLRVADPAATPPFPRLALWSTRQHG